jgi:hypothetical protein
VPFGQYKYMLTQGSLDGITGIDDTIAGISTNVTTFKVNLFGDAVKIDKVSLFFAVVTKENKPIKAKPKNNFFIFKDFSELNNLFYFYFRSQLSICNCICEPAWIIEKASLNQLAIYFVTFVSPLCVLVCTLLN